MEKNVVMTMKPEKPHITCNTSFSFENFWQRLQFAYYCLFNEVEIVSTANFETKNQIDDALQCIREIREPIIFNVMKALPEAIMPTKANEGDTGWDLYTPVNVVLNPGEMKRVDIGIVIDIHPGYEIQVRNRSSTAWKYHTMNPIGVGTIDSLYRGHVMVPLYNFGQEQIYFNRGDRIAQMVIKRVEDVEIQEGKVNTNTSRGAGGFGSSGK